VSLVTGGRRARKFWPALVEYAKKGTMPESEFAIHTRPQRANGLLVCGPRGMRVKKFVKLRHAFDYVRSRPGEGKVGIIVLDPAGSVLTRVEVERQE
jgi:hypothetical protein